MKGEETKLKLAILLAACFSQGNVQNSLSNFCFLFLCPKDNYLKILQNIKGQWLKSGAAGNYWNKQPLITTLQFLEGGKSHKTTKQKPSEELCFMLTAQTCSLQKDLMLWCLFLQQRTSNQPKEDNEISQYRKKMFFTATCVGTN